MKKFLLSALLLGSIASAASLSAANLEMRIDGKDAGDKHTVYLTEANWADDGYGMRTADVTIVPWLTDGGTANISLSAKAVSVEPYDYEGDPMDPGFSICTEKFPESNNCFMLPLDNLALKINNANGSYLHCAYTCYSDVPMPAIVCSYLISWTGDATGQILLTLDSKNRAGVDDILADDAAPKRYFNLQGQEVSAPAPGIYIVRQGSHVSKQVIR